MADKLADQEIADRLALLNTQAAGEWVIANNRLSKEFVFVDFAAAFAFMSRCVVWIERLNHHPEWCNVYNRVSVQLMTHETGGLSQLDFALARKMDECV